MREWVKPGTGTLIINVPSEDHTVQYLRNNPFRCALDKSPVYETELVKDIHTLETVFEDAGLEVPKSFRTRGYLPGKLVQRGSGSTGAGGARAK